MANVLFSIEDIDNFEPRMGLNFEKCPSGYKDCMIWCSKSNCETPSDFEDREIREEYISLAKNCNDGFIKKDTFCYPKCDQIGMVTCEEGICASSQNACKLKRPSFTFELIESYVDFLGHIYTLKSNTFFGWSDPSSFERYKKLLNDKYYQQDKERLEEIANIVSRKESNILDMMYRKSLDFLKHGKDNPVYPVFFQKMAYQVQYSLFNTKLDDENQEFFIKIPNLGSCVLENWTNDDGTPLQWWTRHKKKDPKKRECRDAVYTLIKELKPYMLIGLANGISKPICPFVTMKTGYSTEN
jgi:hypothetical protein